MSGVVSTLGQGSVTQSKSVLLSGQEINAEQEYFELPHGILASFAQGTLTPNYVMSNLELGSVITSGIGNLVRGTTGNAESALEGSGATFSLGSVRPITPLSGSASTSAAGSFASLSWGQALTGDSSTAEQYSVVSGIEEENTYILSSQGTEVPSSSKALTGSASTSSHGQVVASVADRTSSLLGDEININSSSVESFFTWGISKALGGQSITTAQQNMGAPLKLPLTGSLATVSKGFFGWEMRISGSSMTSGIGTMIGVPSGVGVYPIFGMQINSGHGSMQVQREDETEPDKFVILSGLAITSRQGTLTAKGTNWAPAGQPTSEWTPTTNPSSAWVRKDGPSTSWNREE